MAKKYRRDYVKKRQWARTHAAKHAAYIRGLKANPCKDCGEQYPEYVMEFDHVRGRRHRCVSSMSSCSIALIDKEIALCDLVCANCHRRRTHERGESKRRKPSRKKPKQEDS